MPIDKNLKKILIAFFGTVLAFIAGMGALGLLNADTDKYLQEKKEEFRLQELKKQKEATMSEETTVYP